MAFSKVPAVFDHNPAINSITREEALAVLRRAAEAGLVHSVSNNQRDTWYICNCCTCSCAILRGMAEMGVANVVARSAFVNQVDETLCLACQDCLDFCQFDALSVDTVAVVDSRRCVGCGVCVLACPEEALFLVRRKDDEILPPPETNREWGMARAISRGLDLSGVL
jgi:Pyruvate/2-oxoacid:ferredoxin oxidoreductase delta subunit